jgi:diguanylate cyclase (GGDEF)-like protein
MDETALNETGQHSRADVPLAPQPSPLLSPAVQRASCSVSAVLPPAAQLAGGWLAALAGEGGEVTAEHGDIPLDRGSAWSFLTEQTAELVSVLCGWPFRPLQAAAVGHALVKADFVGADVLGRSLRVLILRLPGLITAAALSNGAPGDGAPGDLEQRVAAVTEALANGYVRALRDRTLAEQESIRRAELDAQRIISEQLRHQATHDPLTGLLNRAAAYRRLSAALTAGDGARIGLCYLDLDGFKAVNDRYGHHAGDELLVTVAERIGQVAREHGALAARIGGDEFVVLAESATGLGGIIALATGILAEVNRPVPLSTGRVCVSACAGIVECAAGSPGAASMITDADAALYQAKSRGPGCWAVYGPARQQAS